MQTLGTRVLLAAMAVTLSAVPALAQERREERRVVVAGPSKADMALMRRGTLKLTEDQVRRLEAIRADAERQAEAVLNAEQNAEIERVHARRLRALPRPGMGDAECERSEDGRRVECHRVNVQGERAGAMSHSPEFEICERPSDKDQKAEKCRTIRVRGGMHPMMMMGEPGMMMFGPHMMMHGPGMMPRPGMRRMRMPMAPGDRTVERCEKDDEGNEVCTVRRFHLEMHEGAPTPTTPPPPAGDAQCERKKDDKGNEVVTCRRGGSGA